MAVIPFPIHSSTVPEEDASRLTAAGRQICTFLANHVGRPVTRSTRPKSITAIATENALRFEIAATVSSTLRHRPFGENIVDWIARRDAAPRELAVDVAVAEEWLLDGSLATMGSFGHEFCNPEFYQVETAITWVKAYCRRSPVPRLTNHENWVWNTETVCVPDVENDNREILLAEAVDVYGKKYRERISVSALVNLHGLTGSDANKVVEAVKKLLPRKRP